MSLFEHWVADCAIRHNAAVKAARALDGGTSSGRTAAEAEVSRLSVALITKLHGLADLVRTYGADEVFDAPREPLTAEQRKPAQL